MFACARAPVLDLAAGAVIGMAVENRCTSWIGNRSVSKGFEGTAVVIAIGALVAIVLKFTSIAPVSDEAVGFCIVLVGLGAICAIALHELRRVGSIAKQVRSFDEENQELKGTVKDLQGEVATVRQVRDGLQATLVTSQELNNQQTAQIAQLGGQVDHFKAENTRLETVERELTREVEELRSVVSQLQAILTTVAGSADKMQAYVTKERELQTVREEILTKEIALQAREEVLIQQLGDEASELREISNAFNQKRHRCAVLCVTIFRLQMAELQLTAMLEFVKTRDNSLYVEARAKVLEDHRARIASFRERHVTS